MNIKYFQKARKAALNSRHKFMLGAALVIGKTVYLGWNKAHKTDPSLDCEFPTVHAELDAIKKAGVYRNFSGAKLYIYRAMRNKHVGLAKPCEACQKLIGRYGINEIYYTIDDDRFGSLVLVKTYKEEIFFHKEG